MFTREDGAPLRPDFVTKNFRALALKAGVRPVRRRDLRHGAASLMLSAGVPVAIVSKMLRHSSIGITVDTYQHLDPTTARAASDAIAQLLDAALRDHRGPVNDEAGPSEKTNPQVNRECAIRDSNPEPAD